MAGFGIVMAVLFYGFVGFVAAGIGSICFYMYAKRRRNRRIAITCAASPFLALLWLVAPLLIHVQVSNRLAHQDCGFSPDPYVTLPNGYILGSLNTYDGYFKAPGFETDVPMVGPGYVRSIIDLQLSGDTFTGTQFNFRTSRIRAFTFNTATRVFQTPDNVDSNGKECNSTDPQCVQIWGQAETSAHDDANSYWELYHHYRHRWPSYILIALIVLGEGAIVLGIRMLWFRSGLQDRLP
jgi:hypothetical protein